MEVSGRLHSTSTFPRLGQRHRDTPFIRGLVVRESMWTLWRRANTLIPADNRTTVLRTAARNLVTVSATVLRLNTVLLDNIKTGDGS